MYVEPDTVPTHCIVCGGWDKSVGGTGHKLECPKGKPGTPIATKQIGPLWLLIGEWSKMDSWKARGLVESIRKVIEEHEDEVLYKIKIHHFLGKGICLGIVVGGSNSSWAPGYGFSGYVWHTIIKLAPSENPSQKLAHEMNKY